MMKNPNLIIFGLLAIFILRGTHGEMLSFQESTVLLSRMDATHNIFMKIAKAVSYKMSGWICQCPELKSDLAEWKIAITSIDETCKIMRRRAENIISEIPNIPCKSKRNDYKVMVSMNFTKRTSNLAHNLTASLARRSRPMDIRNKR